MEDIHVIELPARVRLPDGSEHDCRVRFDDAERIEIVVGHPLHAGMRLLCRVEGLGFVDASVAGPAPTGRLLELHAGAVHMARLAARMAWHRRKAAGQIDQRGHGRIVPLSTAVSVRSASGDVMAGTLIDLSATGAALSLPARPDVGVRLVVGRRHATVVRHRDDGVAVRFALPLQPQDVTPEVIL